jgi:hypothetical protein
MTTLHQQLYTFTILMVKRARRLASIGEKDRARDMARFVRNSCIVDILKPFSGELLIDAHFFAHIGLIRARAFVVKFCVFHEFFFARPVFRRRLHNLRRKISRGATASMRTQGAKNRDNRAVLARFLAACANFGNFLERGDGERQDEQKRPTNERHPNIFSVCVDRQHDSAAGGVPLAWNDQPREFPAVASPSGRDGDRAKTSTLCLRVEGQELQAKKEKV